MMEIIHRVARRIAYSLQNQGFCDAKPVFEISANITARYFRQMGVPKNRSDLKSRSRFIEAPKTICAHSRIQSVRKFN